MGEGKADLAAALGPTFHIIKTVVTFLIHFVSQMKLGCIIALMDGGEDRRRRVHGHGVRFGREGGGGRDNGRGCVGRGCGGGGARTTVDAHNYNYAKCSEISNDHKEKFS